MADEPNLFARLHKWATRQDENFLTESLAVVLEQLLILAPETGTRLVKQLTDGFIDVLPDAASSIEISTQVEAVSGRPDLEVRTRNRLVWVEVKVESRLRTGQLEGYRVLLRESGFDATRLILLTRYPEGYAQGGEHADQEVRWFEVTDWLESELPQLDPGAAVAIYLLRQFLNFLRARGMNLTQVGKYLPEGLSAAVSLLNMLGEAAVACGVKPLNRPQSRAIGLYLNEGDYWVGIAFERPTILSFASSRVRVDPAAAAQLVEGTTFEWGPGRGHGWKRELDLDAEEVHFFVRSKVSQIRVLEKFLRECLEMVRRVELPNRAAGPEAPPDEDSK